MSDIPDRLRDALADRYEIDSELGSGGMATVYLARDLKHARRVAIKVLRPELAAVIGGERFVAEIRTTASLQHPHILPLFDSGEADRFLYYVMPYVEGESLRDRLDRDKQLPVEEAIRIAKAVASALHYAHERDIVHRDIKPANILMHAGEPVVADFGIAIAISAAGGGRLTETGMSVGTPHYMSPEQASADRDVDARSDTYALACVLYEMLAGQPPHTGPTAQAVLMRILTENPRAITDVRRSVPGHVRDALSKGLEKLPADRFPTAKAFADALDDSAFQYAPVIVDATVQALPAVRREERRPSPMRVVLPIVAAIVGLAGGAVLFGGDGTPGSDTAPAARFEVGLGNLTLEIPEIIHVSPDGRTLAFVGDLGALDGIFVRGVGDLEFRHLTGTEFAEYLAFSPNGSSILFAQDDATFHVVPVGGGSSREIADVSPAGVLSMSWSPDGRIIAALVTQDGPSMAAIPASGGAVERLFDTDGRLAWNPTLLPGGRAVLYGTPSQRELLIRELDADSSRVLVSGGMSGVYLPTTGDLVYVDAQGGLWAVPFDLDQLDLAGDPVPVLDGVVVSSGFAPLFSISDTGTLVYQRGPSGSTGATFEHRLEVVHFDGRREEVPIVERRYRNVRWSPDGRSIAFAALEADELSGFTSLYTYDVELRTATRRWTEEGVQGFPVWSPDGGSLAFIGADRTGGGNPSGFGGIDAGELMVLELATGEIREIAATPSQDVPYHWDARSGVVFTGGPNNGTSDLRYADPDGSGEGSVYLDIDGDLGAVTVSPDGRWAAYRTARGVNDDVHIAVRTFPDAGPPIRVSEGFGDRPRWSRDGNYIFYWDPSGDEARLLRARVRTDNGFEVVSTEEVLSGTYPLVSTWDLHPDGDRIVIAVPATVPVVGGEEEEEELRHLAVVNWFSELRRAKGGGN